MFDKDTLKLGGSHSWSNESYSGFYFGVCHEPKDGVVNLVSGTHSCRDGFGGKIREYIMGANETLETDKARVFFRWSNFGKGKPEAWAERGLAAIHSMEKLAGWPLTRAKVVEVPSSHFGLYCRGSRRWIKAPYLITLYVLLMRMCSDARITGYKDANGLVELIGKLGKLERDSDQVKATYKYWTAIMLGYPDLFRQFKITYYWDSAKLNDSNGYGEGIYRLCTGATKFPKIYTKLKEIQSSLEKK